MDNQLPTYFALVREVCSIFCDRMVREGLTNDFKVLKKGDPISHLYNVDGILLFCENGFGKAVFFFIYVLISSLRISRSINTLIGIGMDEMSKRLKMAMNFMGCIIKILVIK